MVPEVNKSLQLVAINLREGGSGMKSESEKPELGFGEREVAASGIMNGPGEHFRRISLDVFPGFCFYVRYLISHRHREIELVWQL